MNINGKLKQENTYDAIVVGTGISGGWAAKELCEKGLNTLVLDRGRDVPHGDYPTATKESWELPYGGRVPPEELKKYPVQSRRGNAISQATKHWWVNDLENPYTEVQPFDWRRGYHVGGRSLMWGRMCLRWSDLDFEANARDGHGTDWPIRYQDLAPWYDHVESFVGVSAQAEGLAQLPDGKFIPPMEMNCLEKHVKGKIAEHFGGRVMTIARSANLSQPHLGRGPCQYRSRCVRGCPYGGYFSSNSATLPAAAATGRMTLRPHSIVNAVLYDESTGKATGVRVIDALSGEVHEFFSKIVFLNASTIGSAFILLNSTSSRFLNGLGNDSDQLGRNLMDHHFLVGASGTYQGFEDRYYTGRRPSGCYIPRYRNVDKKSARKDYLRGFGVQAGASRSNWTRAIAEMSFGAAMKEELRQPGAWRMGVNAFGECLPNPDNRITLNHDLQDKWGQATLNFDCAFGENEQRMREDMKASSAEMLEAAGLVDVREMDIPSNPGSSIHEMGTACMGRDPKTSVLNAHNQVHAVPNVFVTDGACMTSSAWQNPSLTYMALTARACDYAVAELKRRNL